MRMDAHGQGWIHRPGLTRSSQSSSRRTIGRHSRRRSRLGPPRQTAADTGVAARAAAATFGLAFLPLAWEPFELALPGDALDVAEPLIEAVRIDGPALAQRLGGYELLA